MNVIFTQDDKDEMARLYRSGKSLRQIASVFCCYPQRVSNYLHKMGVEMRPVGGQLVHERSKASKGRRTSEWFESAVIRSDGDDCWGWLGAVNRGGYPIMGKMIATRLSLSNKLGRPIRKGLFALHTCDNPICTNPDHLYEGDARQNIQDAVNRGRLNPNPSLISGSRNGRSKLTEDQVGEIRSRYQDGERPKVLINEYPISKSQFWRIVNNEHWK